MKQFKFERDAREALLAGVEVLARAVTTTLGPKGRNAGLDRKWSSPIIVHDGVTVAKDIDLPDPFENMGAQVVKEASSKTNDRAGDGTTTSTLLAYEIVKAGVAYLDKVKEVSNPMSLKKGIELAVEEAVKKLKEMSQPVDTTDKIASIATISSASPEIGKLVAEAMERVGKEGVITVDTGSGLETKIEYKEGMEIEGGVGSHYFYTDESKSESEIENPFVLLTTQKLENPMELLPLMEKIVKEGQSKELIVIAESYSDGVVATFAANWMKGSFKAVPLKAPGFGERRIQYLQDIAVLTGATVLTKENMVEWNKVLLENLGRCERVIANKEKEQFIGGLGTPEKIKEHVSNLQAQLKQEENEFEKTKLKERIARLTGGAALIRVGAQTQTELDEVKERVKDAVEAAKSAVEEGYVIGGGLALRSLTGKVFDTVCSKIQKDGYDEKVEKDIIRGVEIVCTSFLRPYAKILENAGYDVLEVSDKLENSNVENAGMKGETGKVVNMREAGVIDPTKVVRSALENAASVAAMILTTDVLVTFIPEDKKEKKND